MTTSNEHNNAHAQEQCNACCGTGRMVRDPDIGTDQECFVCDGTGFLPAQEVGQDDHVSIGRVMAEQWLSAMEGVIDVADRNTEEFDALRKSIIDLALLLHAAPASTQTSEMTVDYVMAIFQKRFPRTRLSNAWRDSAEDIIKALRAKESK